MYVTFYDDVSVFWETTKHFLLQQEDINNLVISNCLKAIEADGVDDVFMAVVKDATEIWMTAMLLPPYNLLLSAARGAVSAEAVDAFVQAVGQSGITVNGIQAEARLAEQFAAAYKRATNCAVQYGHKLRVYTLNKVNNIRLPSGTLRPVVQSDMAFLPYWLQSYRHDCKLIPKTLPQYYDEAAEQISGQAKQLYIWTNSSGTPLSMAAIGRRTLDAAVINQVYTPPYWRQMGYATAAVSCITKIALEQGAVKCCLFADANNPTSNGIYKRIGYEQNGDYDEVMFTVPPQR